MRGKRCITWAVLTTLRLIIAHVIQSTHSLLFSAHLWSKMEGTMWVENVGFVV